MTNDEKILQLKETLVVKEEKHRLSNVRFTPKTNCRLEIFGIVYNLHTLSKDILIELLAYLESQKLGLISFEPKYLTNFLIQGFHINDWISDINLKIIEKSKIN